uniref:Uncharacterized protein n=1 Tax=Lygus hesperus TaxID=30085 RepID=A0A0A9Z925_LYGHE
MIELDIECSPASTSLDLKRVDRLCHALENRQELMSQVRKHLRLRPPQQDRVKLPTLADRFNHTRNVSKSTMKYFTTGRHVPPGCERDVTKEKNPFSRPKDTDILQKVFMHSENRNQAPESCFIQKHCMNPCPCKFPNTETKKCNNQSKKRSSWESAHSSFQVGNKGSTVSPKCPPEMNPICARLYVPDVPIPPSKTDFDPEYFNVARGRPVKETFNRHEFSKIQKTVFFQKLFAGFLDDEVKKRQEQHRLDMWELTNISRELDRMKATQEEFANQSHSESVNIVTEQMAISKIREKREEELLRCKGYVNVIKSSLYKKDDMLSTSMYCRDILLQLSPTKFRNDYEEEVQAYRKETSQLANQAITIFTEYCRYNPDPDPICSSMNSFTLSSNSFSLWDHPKFTSRTSGKSIWFSEKWSSTAWSRWMTCSG